MNGSCHVYSEQSLMYFLSPGVHDLLRPLYSRLTWFSQRWKRPRATERRNSYVKTNLKIQVYKYEQFMTFYQVLKLELSAPVEYQELIDWNL